MNIHPIIKKLNENHDRSSYGIFAVTEEFGTLFFPRDWWFAKANCSQDIQLFKLIDELDKLNNKLSFKK